jgi:phosphatidylinositol alpha-1,6-mannosyltransferase
VWFAVAVYAHGTEVLHAVGSPWLRPRQALVEATRVFACSRYTAQILVDSVGVRPERIRVLNPGCDTTRFSPEVSPDAAARIVGDAERRRPILLSVGNLVERKGHDTVLRALPRLATRWPDLLYVIVGDGAFRPHLAALAHELGVERLVRFVGRADLTTLPSFYRLCDVFVMPSRFLPERNDVEGFGIVYLEAGASGKPVVAGRSGGTADAVVDGETGLLADPTSHENVAAALARVLENPAFAAELGRNARERIVKHFTWSTFAQKLRHEMTAMVRER